MTLKATAIQARASLPVRGESDPCKDDPNPHCDRSQIVHDRNEDERSRCWNCKYICENHAELCYQTECYKHMDDEVSFWVLLAALGAVEWSRC